MAKQTKFKEWRLKLGLTQAEAAEKLHKSLRQIKNYDAGKDHRKPPRPSIPDLPTRIYMRILDENISVKPWPDK